TRHLDAPAVRGDDAVADGEPQPGADAHALRREAGIEDARQMRGGDAGARVVDIDPQVGTVDADADADRPRTLDGLDRVDQQVHEHLVELARVAGDRGDRAVLTHDLDAPAAQVLDQRQR